MIVSTHTISLQEQLIARDIPFLNAVLPVEFSAVLAKGRSNYISLRRLAAENPTNPAFMHPDDLAALGVQPGDVVEIASKRATILGVVEADDTLRRGLVSMTHAWGDGPERDQEVRTNGGATARLSDVDDAFDPYSGQPVMSNIPVAVRPTPGR